MLLAAASAGCRKPAPPATRPAGDGAEARTQPAKKDAPDAPDLPVDVERDLLVSKILVKDTTVADRDKKARYRQDAQLPAGKLRGICAVAWPGKPVDPPRELPLWPAGRNAVKDPEKGEVAYWETHPPRRRFPIGPYDRQKKRYGVGQAVLILRGIESGPRPRLSRPSFIANYRTGQIEVPQDGYNYGSGGICFGPLYERIQFANTEFFDCRLQVARAAGGKVFYAGTLRGYHDPKFPHVRYGLKFGMVPPKLIQTRPLLEPGRYEITCGRHPWYKAHLFVVDNPYVCVTRPDGTFTLSGVPAGEYELQVWHPEYSPDQTTYRVKIDAFKTTELTVPFKAPVHLTDPIVPTSQTVRRWVYAGPFEEDVKKVHPPEEGIDFNARYETQVRPEDGPPRAAQAAWHLINANAAGTVDVRSVLHGKAHGAAWYVASVIDSPAAQQAVFRVRVPREGKIWLNGELIYQRPYYGEEDYHAARRLKAGRNTLLVRLNCGRRWQYDASAAVRYHSPGAKVVVPEAEHLRTGYVPDPLLDSASLTGVCFVGFDKPVHLPRLVQMDLTGKLAPVEPAEGELAHYTGRHRPARGVLLGRFDDKQKRYGVRRAVLILKDVRAGRRLPLKPTTLFLHGGTGAFELLAGGHNYGSDFIAFNPVREPFSVLPSDVFADSVVVADAAGKVVSETPLPAYKDKYFPGEPYHPRRTGMGRPKEAALPALARSGRYVLTGKRHPWVRGHLFVTTHPYVAVTDDNGGFRFPDAPAGKHVVEVWHPLFTPEKDRYEITIEKDKPATLDVKFKVPKLLSDPPRRTDQTVVEWVYTGPFKADHAKAYPPEQKVDFAAQYPREGAPPVGWSRVNADATGQVDLCRLIGHYTPDATWYLACLIETPKAQPVPLGLGACQVAKVFLNGKWIHDRPDSRQWRKDEDYVRGDLNKGQNLLLVKVSSTSNQWPAASVTFRAPGAAASAPADARLVPPYLRDVRPPTGQIAGVCFAAAEKAADFPRHWPLDLSGANAVRKPADGEVEFFERNLPTGNVWLGQFDDRRKRYPVAAAALVLRDVKSGKRFPLTPTGLTVDAASSQPDAGRNANYGRFDITFSRTGETLSLATGEVFPAEFALTRAGQPKPACQVPVAAYADKRYPGKCYGEVQHMHPPKGVWTPALTAPGLYRLTCLRHPWRRGCVFVTDHPYVAVSEWDGRFRIDDVPAGKYTLEVWHGDYEPVSATAQVTVAAGKTAEVNVAFKPPAILKSPPAVPVRTVGQWVGIGPFALDPKAAQPPPPEKEVNFKAAYPGKGGASLRWRLMNAGKDGVLNLTALAGQKVRRSTWYALCLLGSPKAQRAVFGIGSPEMAKVWLNGKLICHWPNRTNSWSANQDFVVGHLKRGSNTLLVRIDCYDQYCGVVVTCDAPGLKPAVPADRSLREGYVHQPAAAGGTLRGLCYVPFDKPVHVPHLVQLDLSGKMALRDPKPGEAAHYAGAHRPAVPVLLGGFDAGRKRYGVRLAAVRALGVRSGRRLPLKPNRLDVDPRISRLQVESDNFNYSRDVVAFTPAGERLSVALTDVFGYDLALTDAASGRAVFEAAGKPYKDPKNPSLPYNRHRQGMAPPEVLRTAPLDRPGRYLLAARRRPWCRAHVFVADNPYVATTDDGGGFTLADLPAGKHVIEVWHPHFEPVKKIHEVQIVAGKTCELNVEFKVPQALAKPPPYPDRTIEEWLYVGPFDYGHDKPHGPEAKLDLSAAYEGKDKRPLAWRRINADRRGQADLWRGTGLHVRDATWYACATIDSPKAQPVTLAVGSAETCKLWLNGTCLYDRPDGHRWRKDEDIVLGQLNAGPNRLLAKVTSHGEAGVSVSLKAEGATASVPSDGRLMPKYIRDDRLPTGILRGQCFAALDKPVVLPPALPIRAVGAHAVRSPVAGEAAHFERHVPSRPVWLGRFDANRKRVPIIQAAVMLREVRAGPRSPLSPTGFSVGWASSQPETHRGHNYSAYDVAFGPAGEALGLSSGEVFPTHLVLSAAGKAVAELALPAYADPRYPGKGYGQVGGMAWPKGFATAPLPAGRYDLTCKRHPWKRACAILLDHPYVALTDGAGNFEMRDIPAGKYTLDLWHADFKPLKAAVAVEIAKGKAVQVDLPFQPPALLTRPPAVPRGKVAQWACIGPFDRDHGQGRSFEPAEQVAKGIDFKASCEGKGKRPVRWRLYNADAAGTLHLGWQAGETARDSTWYAAAVLNAPSDRKVLFGLGTPEMSRLWLNGKLIYQWPHRTNSTAANQGYLVAPLKRGPNALLVRINSVGTNAALALTFDDAQVKAAAPPGAHLVPAYMWRDVTPAGKIQGNCYVPCETPVPVPRMVQLDLTGADALRGPVKGEAEHYSGPGRPGRPVWLGPFDAKSKRHAVRRAVIVVHGIRSGPRLPLRPTRVQVNPSAGWVENHRRGENYSTDAVCFAPAGQPLPLIVTDIFPYAFQVKDAAGKVVSETPADAYADPKRPGRPYAPGMAAPKTVVLPPVAKAGRYTVTCNRHGWLRGNLFVCDHPYVAVSDDNGNFSIDGLPPGRYAVDVWHGDFTPARSRLQVTVAADKPAELAVAFQPTPALAKPTPCTDQTIVEWVRAGPFPRDHDAPRGPEQKLDFAARYEGKDKAPVAWQRVNADKTGHLDLARATGLYVPGSTWYFAALIHSPRPQPAVLGVGSSEQCRLWLNGQLVYDRPDGHGWRRDEDIVKAALKAGANVLLVKLSRNDGRPDMSVTFKAPGAKPAVPPGRHLQPAYLWDERLPTGQIGGVCFTPFDKQVPLPPHLPVPRPAIPQPAKGEAEHYDALPLVEPVGLGSFDGGKKHYRVADAVLILRGVPAGRRPPFGGSSLTIDYRSSQLQTRHNENFGRGNLAFCGAGHGLALANTEIFGAHLVFTHLATRKAAFDVPLAAYADPRHPGKACGEVQGMAGAKTVSSPPLTAPGQYLVAGKRHRWKRAHLFVVTHPYVALSDGNGGFRFDDVPAGKYTLDVWHPKFAPLKAALPVTVTAGKATTLDVGFKTPAILTRPPPVPDQAIARWLFLGPFDAGKEPKGLVGRPPVGSGPAGKGPDLAARHAARGGVQVAWKAVEGERVDMAAAAGKAFKKIDNAVADLLASLDSPKAQDAALSVSADDSAEVWLNGRSAGRGGPYMLLRLQAGRNYLLVRLANGGGASSLSVKYHAPGVKLAAPPAP